MNKKHSIRVAVFGGTGFVGGYLVDALVSAGHVPSLLVRPGSEHKVRHAGKCQITCGDIDSDESIAAVLDGCDAAIYCIGILREDRRHGITFEALQYDGVVRVADIAARNGVKRFILMSANGARQPGTAYQETKLSAEQHVLASDLDVTVFRPSVIFGDPRGTMEFATQLYQDLVAPPLPAVGFTLGFLPTSGRLMMSPVHIEDVAAAFVRSLEHDQTIGMTYELGGPEILSWQDMLRRIAATVGRSKFVLPMPIPLMKAAALLLDRLPFFPVTHDQLTMLAEGNTASHEALARLIGRSPRKFDENSLSYLAESH